MTEVWATNCLYRITDQSDKLLGIDRRIIAGLITPSFSNEAMFIICAPEGTAIPKDSAEIVKRKAEFTVVGGLPKALIKKGIETGNAFHDAFDGCIVRSENGETMIIWTTALFVNNFVPGPMSPPRPQPGHRYRHKHIVKMPTAKILEFLRT